MKNSLISQSLIKLPTPSNINSWWNLGFLLGLTLSSQILTGLFLSLHYCPESNLAFTMMNHINRDVNWGWLIQIIHMNMASLFFILIYAHLARGLFFSSFTKSWVWISGIIILLILMITAFLGYVLPWGQMSFWGATVITNLLSSIPYLGNSLVQWIWGGFSVDNSTLNRFYSFHFLFPFLLIALVLIHLVFLHTQGSSNPLGTNSNKDKIPFNPFFFLKDILFFMIMLSSFLSLILTHPFALSDAENFNLANPLTTPIHIQPEWYFLFAYAILRSIPNKLGGVIALIFSILIMGFLPLISKKILSNKFKLLSSLFLWSLLNMVLLLTWIGSCPVEEPFILMGQSFSTAYFSLILMMMLY